MSKQQNSNFSDKAKPIDYITPANKRYMIFFTTTVVMIAVAIIITSYTL